MSSTTSGSVSDSEEELPIIQSSRKRSAMQIIEISSDSEDDGLQTSPRKPVTHPDGNDNRCTTYTTQHNDVIELTDCDSSDTSELPDMLWPLVKGPAKKGPMGSRTQDVSSKQFIPLYADASDDEDPDEDCMLILNDPPRSRKPIRSNPVRSAGKTFPPAASSQLLIPSSTPSDDDIPNGNPLPGPSSPTKKILPVSSPRKPSSKRPVISKKVQEAAEQARREKYATELFAELNRNVFGNRLPKSTTLEWSKRLLTTAGRARWHRSRDGVHNTKIELAAKILDCDERIRNTLSHEMCHLACWIIDNHPQEGHGQLFKSWANKVTRTRPDIHISTRHNYEIAYPYEWKCNTCSKIYGRYSKSIRPDECVCGVCKTGKLVPLFTQRAAHTPKVSRMAIDKCQVATPSKNDTGIQPSTRRRPSMSDDEDDLSGLANILRGISLKPT